MVTRIWGPWASYAFTHLCYYGHKPNYPKVNLSHLSDKNVFDIYYNKNDNFSFWGNSVSFKKPFFECFGSRTQDLLYNLPHKTLLLKYAQSFLGRIVEYTPQEYARLSKEEKEYSQMKFIGKYGTPGEAWCAHTVSALCEMAGINIGGHKKAVAEFINWARQKKIYIPIETKTLNSSNYKEERKNRASQIRKHSKFMKEGDLIVWKSDVIHSTQLGLKKGNASHIGIIECVNPDGSISVLEGNANEYRSDSKYERYVATNRHEASSGNQIEGEMQEINPRDGFIRKVYTPEQLAASGYSGYINMQGLVR